MKKIGIFGGTFNPIHNGHLNMAERIGYSLGLDIILIIPAKMPPHKSFVPIIDSKHRYEMCRLACEKNPVFKLCGIELEKDGRSYTIDTLKELSSDYKDCKLYLIMGSDSFLSVVNWVGFEEIIRIATLCTAPRGLNEMPCLNKMHELLKSRGIYSIICNIPVMPVSSTIIRKSISSGLEVGSMVPEKVYDYIKRNNLYNKIDYEDLNIKLNLY